jgi:hypothetical protein
MVDAYRRLRDLRARFDDLIAALERIGTLEKSSRDLETKIDQESARVSSNNLEQIENDLQMVVQENVQMVGKLKKASGQR